MIIFLFTGQSRKSPFSNNNDNESNDILKSYDKYIFTNEFRENYKYKIYMSTDDINIELVKRYFCPNTIGNIHLFNNDFYLNESKKINTIDKYFNRYNNKDFLNCQKYDNSIHEMYKVLDCYSLYENSNYYENATYIVRIRFDTIFNKNIINILNFFEKKSCEILMHSNIFAIGKQNIMKYYCKTLDNKYGDYNYDSDLSNIDYPLVCDVYKLLDKNRWTYAPEFQLFETLFEYCNKNNLNINDTLIPIDFCEIFR
jgi:hypothetical protein